MGHPIRGGILKRTSTLCNNKCFSDVEFHFRGTTEASKSKVLYAHKLILSMAGEGFAKLFYNTSKDHHKSIKIVEYSPRIFEMMLRYVYCDEIEFSNLEDVMNLIKIAKTFGIYDLRDECNTYISKFHLNIDTIFAKYETALSYRGHELIPSCRRFVCHNTKECLECPQFRNASLAVIEDIMKLDGLTVSNEMEVIEAAINWGKAECERKNRPLENLCIRAAILPLFKHLRFLCLDVNEILNFVEKYDILISIESTKLTAKILDPQNSSLTVPDDFSAITTSRKGVTDQVNGHQQRPPSPLATETKTTIPAPLHSNPSFNKSEPGYSNHSVNNTINVLRPSNSKTSARGPVQPLYIRSNSEMAQPTPPISDSLPLYQKVPPKKNTPVLKVIPQSKPASVLFYDFPLHEMQKGMGSAFANDVKCSAEIKMLRGSILIRGIELNVKDLKTSTEEFIEVHLCFFNNNSAHRSDTQELKLKNNTMELAMDGSYAVTPDNPLVVEVAIEDLKLSRCSVFRSQESVCEINSGLGVAAEISLRSNQSNGSDSFFFLISKLIYTVL